MPQPLEVRELQMPQLQVMRIDGVFHPVENVKCDMAEGLLDVSSFKLYVAATTEAHRPIYLHKHLLDVHDPAVEKLQEEKMQLVSLIVAIGLEFNIRVGVVVSPQGVGKTWCGWLVAHTLQKTKNVAMIHVAITGKILTTVAKQSETTFVKKVYMDATMSLNLLMSLVKDYQVCILDVGDLDRQSGVSEVFRCMRSCIEHSSACAKFLALCSGHSEDLIHGTPNLIKAAKLVMWSWTSDEVNGLSKLRSDTEHAFAVCGGSVRYLFEQETDKIIIKETVRQLDQREMEALLKLDVPTSDEGHKQRTRLLAFCPRQNQADTFQEV
eukprot:6465544-Amphidinium_carterae.2